MTDMLKENVLPHLLIADDLEWQFKTGVGRARQGRNRVKGSIRELELMAANLRLGGENRAADELDGDIMAMLEKKICRKIINRSRKEQKMLHMGPA
ncbi:MAG: hypothetical protein AB2710_18220 [Candidatus Thiodiazotropha sp.]